MKKFFLVALSILLLNVSPAHVLAETNDAVITDAQITTIRAHCSDIKSTLYRLGQSDTLLRYNRGQLYRTIADKLMVPLNQRIASNQLDGSELVATTASFNKEYQVFFDAYKNYDIALSAAVDIDCKKQPTTFYDKIADARDKRIALHESSERMVALATQYKKQFDVFRQIVNDEEQNNG